MKRWKRWSIRIGLGVVVLPTLFAVGNRYHTRWSGESRLAEVHAELDATDPGWRLDELLEARYAKFPPDDQNPMSYMRRIHPREPEAFKSWSRKDPNWLSDLDPNRLPDPADAAEARRVRAECLDVIEPLRRLRHMTAPGGYRLDIKPNVLETLLGPTQQVRGVVTLLQLDAMVYALDGNPDQAIESAHAALNAGRGIGEEPMLISMLVRMACDIIAVQTAERVLGWGQPKNGLAELQTAFTAEAEEPLLSLALRGERAMFDRLFENVDSGEVGLGELTESSKSASDPTISFATWTYRGYLSNDRAAMLRAMTGYLDASGRPPHEQPELFAQVPRPPREFTHLLSGLLLPAIDKMAAADWRTKARLRAAAVGIACERFRQANGRWPNDLAEIPIAILPAIPIDPFDGQPIRYRRSEDGVVIYAVGPDRTDDGGNLTTKNANLGEDYGFRLWDPEHRRAAPLPKIDSPSGLGL